MVGIFDSFRNITTASVILRVVLAMILGSVIGLERSSKNRPAGFRTHVLVCCGASAASMTGHYIYLVLNMPADPTRIGAQVITGLGFIGAGTILITSKNKVKGLTTAAGLWATGIVGLALGAGFYEGGIIAGVLILTAETVFGWLGQFIRHAEEFRITVRYCEKSVLDSVLRFCKDRNLSIKDLKIMGSRERNAAAYRALITLLSYSGTGSRELLEGVRKMDGVFSAQILDEYMEDQPVEKLPKTAWSELLNELDRH